jgi:hypothetical protein
MAVRDGMGERRRADVLGIYSDLRPRAAVLNVANANYILPFGISEAISDPTGVIGPGIDRFSRLLDYNF